MRTMGDTIKVLEPDISANNIQAATDEAQVFSKGFEYVETYFTAKGTTPDAVKYAQDSRVLTDKVLHALSSHDTDGAAAAARDLAHSCKSCHDVYKPP
jgi:cytochrome c556